MSDFFVDYIEEEMCGGHVLMPEVHEDQNHSFQSSQPSEPSAQHVDVDVLVLLAQDEIRTVEHPIQPRWNQFQWDGDQWELGDSVPKTEYQERKEDIPCPGTSSEASLGTNSDSEADMWSPVGVSSDGPSISAFEVDTLLVGSEDLCRQPDSLLLMLESPLQDLPPLSGNDAQDQNEGLNFAENAGILEHDQVPAASPGFIARPGARAGKTIRKTPMRPPRKKVEYPISEQQLKPSRFRTKDPKHTSNSHFHRSLKAKATLLNFVPSASVPWATTDRRSTPETLSHHRTANSTRSPSNLARATGYNLRTRSFVGVQTETKPSEAKLGGETSFLSTTKEHQRQSVRNVVPPRMKLTPSTPGDFAARASTRLEKRSFQLSDQDTDSDASGTQPPQKRQRRTSDQGPPKRSKSLKLDNALSEAGFIIRDDVLRCSCRMTFTRSWEAKRHWKNASAHKVQRLHEGDDTGLLENFCTKCKQFLARKDSLARHIPKCGLRKKRGCQIRMDLAGNVRLADG